MKYSKKFKLVIIFIVLVLAFVGFGLLFNACFFHKNATQGTDGHYEPKVYITPTGKCYHQHTCSYTTNISPVGLYEAQRRGYKSCSYCGGETHETIWIEGIKAKPVENNYILSFSISFILISIAGIYIYGKANNQQN
ncbi:MAG: hypothetical protein IJ358_00545 [Clostridia bacterium]|nr:hypothetical protein [Clostridia bacterium]